MCFDSVVTKTLGDEAGTAKGIKSGTVGDIIEPTSHSTIVRINGHWAIRHRDNCTLNKGNCPDELILVKSTDIRKAPDGNNQSEAEEDEWQDELWRDGFETEAPPIDKPWYKDAWDWTKESAAQANKAVWDFDKNNYNAVTRGFGFAQAVGGGAEAIFGAGMAGLGGTVSATGIGAAPGVLAMAGGSLLAVNGYDNFSTGLRQLWTGKSQTTAVAQASGGIAGALGASPETVQMVENIAGGLQGGAGAAGTLSSASSRLGKAASAAHGARKTADDAAETSGHAGLRVSRTGARFGRATSDDYRATFFETNPSLKGKTVVHHAVEQQVLTRYPGVVSKAEIHSLENLRGIPKSVNSDLHLSQIRREWNQFYRQNANPTKQQLLDKATEIDNKFGGQFIPPVR